MKINGKWRGVLVAGLLTIMISPASAEENQEDLSQYLPQVMQQGEITYTSGGYGLEERDALKATEGNYNLMISNAVKQGEFTTAETVVIRNTNNHQKLTVEDVGPLFYAKLPAGTYVIQTFSGDERSVRTVSITGKKQARIYLIWSS